MVLARSRLDTLMPSSRFSSLQTAHPSFLKHRYDDQPRTLPLKINLAIPTPLPAWGLPTPPMTGTPPPDPPSDPPQLAGRRRKREDTPPPTSTIQEPSQPILSTTTLDVSPLIEQTGQRYGESSRAGRTSDHSMLPGMHGMPWDQQPNFMGGGGQGYALVTSSLPPRPMQVSPRATRKVKAHVASACVNCKRKHLRCDESRPCRRCVAGGKEDTCKDVEHKKRGRPPLKDHGSESGRTTSAGVALPPIGSASNGRPGPHLVPLLPTPQPSRIPYGATYAAPSIAQSSATAHGQFSGSQRPFAFPMSRPTGQNFMHSYSQPLVPSYGYTTVDQPSLGYSSGEYPTPIFARRPVPSQQYSDPNITTFGQAPLQLPPILPTPPNTSTETAIAQQQRQYMTPNNPYGNYSATPYGHHAMPRTQASYPGESPDERDPKRPKMDVSNILGPRE